MIIDSLSIDSLSIAAIVVALVSAAAITCAHLYCGRKVVAQSTHSRRGPRSFLRSRRGPRSFLPCDKARALLAKGAQLVDVRSFFEHKENALPGAVHLPLSSIQDGSQTLNRSQPVLIYGANNKHSQEAAVHLKAAGFDPVYNLGAYTTAAECMNHAVQRHA